MQTFLPFSDFALSARCLDNKRLNKQLVECVQILDTLSEKSRGWINHPIIRMWRGCRGILRVYGLMMYVEWRRRLVDDERNGKFDHASGDKLFLMSFEDVGWPWWLGDERFHASHRAALLFKNRDYYGKFGWVEEPKIDYWWPLREGECAIV